MTTRKRLRLAAVFGLGILYAPASLVLFSWWLIADTDQCLRRKRSAARDDTRPHR